jgi:hypothetical protein
MNFIFSHNLQVIDQILNNQKSKKMRYTVFSQNLDRYLVGCNNKETYLKYCFDYLEKNPDDILEIHYFSTFRIIAFFEINPKNGVPSKVVLKGTRQYYKKIEL